MNNEKNKITQKICGKIALYLSQINGITKEKIKNIFNDENATRLYFYYCIIQKIENEEIFNKLYDLINQKNRIGFFEFFNNYLVENKIQCNINVLEDVEKMLIAFTFVRIKYEEIDDNENLKLTTKNKIISFLRKELKYFIKIIENTIDSKLKEITTLALDSLKNIEFKSNDEILKILSSKATDIVHKASDKNKNIDEITDFAIYDIDGKSKVKLIGYPNDFTMPTSFYKTFDIVNYEFAKINNYGDVENLNTVVNINLDNILKLKEKNITKTNKDQERSRTKEDLKILHSLRASWEEYKKNNQSYIDVSFIYKVEYKKNTFSVYLTPDFAKYLNTSYILKLPKKMFALSGKDNNTYTIGRKLIEHYNINSGKGNPNKNRISVKTLLEHFHSLPTYEEVKKGNRNYTERIIEPFEKTLDNLEEQSIIKWNFLNEKKEHLTDEELYNFNYDIFIKCYVFFEIEEYID